MREATTSSWGGADTDTYQFSGSFGSDTITDSDGNGSIVIGTAPALSGGKRIADSIWQSDDKLSLFTKIGGDLVIKQYADAAHASLSGTITITGWDQMQGNHLGITLQDANAPAPAPPPTNVVDGTENPDTIEGTTASDLIRGLGSDDWLEARVNDGGNDWLDGGSGNDMVIGGSGNDTLEGGFGRDVLLADVGEDELWGGARTTFDIVNGQTQGDADSEADLLGGAPGNDSIYGGAGNDGLFGSSGTDFMVAGAGDDNIFGDGVLNFVDRDTWQLNRQVTTDAQGATTYKLWFLNFQHEEAATQDADLIFAGAGNDWVFAGGADDIVDGSEGDDRIYGMAGADIIDGGDGNDELTGDGQDIAENLDYTPAAAQGSDIIYGGAGNDTMRGYGADDYLDGEDDDDKMSGGAGSDELFGGIGNDYDMRRRCARSHRSKARSRFARVRTRSFGRHVF